MDADLLIILSNVPGLMTAHPKHDPDAKIIPIVENVTADTEKLVHSDKSDHGTGGMSTKLQAARHATSFGVHCVIVDGMSPGKITEVMSGRFTGTFFCAKEMRTSGAARRHWIATHRPLGTVTIDDGAGRALVEARKSLLPVGIRSVRGKFKKGDVISIEKLSGEIIAQGITNYDSRTLELIAGKRGIEIVGLCEEATYEEAVHSNNIVLL
jgi:glutamate 5-kinase